MNYHDESRHDGVVPPHPIECERAAQRPAAPAQSKDVAREIVDYIKGGTLPHVLGETELGSRLHYSDDDNPYAQEEWEAMCDETREFLRVKWRAHEAIDALGPYMQKHIEAHAAAVREELEARIKGLERLLRCVLDEDISRQTRFSIQSALDTASGKVA